MHTSTALLDPARKLFADAPALLAASARLPRPWVFTNGVFDLLHRGHAAYLAQAKTLGASLIVGVNADASARGLGKGPERPLVTERDRAYLLAALESTDAVLPFAEPTPLALIAALRPEVYVKGGDYDIERLAETALVRSWGGQAHALPFVEGFSTTALVRRIEALASNRS
ncbi:MAG: adenylyltransferase/cytidyltransferase family protein [Burkholderiaceae bacterium]|nr:adenylyltransferase/cytidyltransferase family protein [Burkholderiaceae bacterium]